MIFTICVCEVAMRISNDFGKDVGRLKDGPTAKLG